MRDRSVKCGTVKIAGLENAGVKFAGGPAFVCEISMTSAQRRVSNGIRHPYLAYTRLQFLQVVIATSTASRRTPTTCAAIDVVNNLLQFGRCFLCAAV